MDGLRTIATALRDRARSVRAWAPRHKPVLAVGAGVAALALVVGLVVVPSGSGSSEELVAEEPTPTASEQPAPTTTTAPTPTAQSSASTTETATPGASAEAPTSSPSSSREPVADASLLLTTSWVDATFGHGRPLVRVDGGGYDACSDAAPRSAGAERGWAWPDETMVLEELSTARSEAGASQLFDTCTEPRLHPADSADPVRSRSLTLGDEALVIRTERPLFVDTVAVARAGRTVVLVAWVQSGRVESDAPAERLLRAAVATLLGQRVPAPVPAPAPEPAPEVHGYLGSGDVGYRSRGDWTSHYWRGDHASEGSLRCEGGDSATSPGAPELRLAGTAVERRWSGGANSPEFGWGFTRGHAPDEETARDDFMACRTFQRVTDLPDVGDEAFCVAEGGALEGLRCFARRGATYYRFSDTSGNDLTEYARLLRLAVERDPGT